MSVIRDIRRALAETLSNGGLNCEEYEEFTLPRTPCATLMLENARVTEWDQQYGFGSIQFKLRNYHSFGGSARTVDQNLDDDMTTILVLLGADRTLNGRVIDVEITSVNRYYDSAPQPRYGWCEWILEVTPYANRG